MSKSISFQDLSLRARLQRPALCSRAVSDTQLLRLLVELRAKVLSEDWGAVEEAAARCFAYGAAAARQYGEAHMAMDLQAMVLGANEHLAVSQLAHTHSPEQIEALEAELAERRAASQSEEGLSQRLEQALARAGRQAPSTEVLQRLRADLLAQVAEDGEQGSEADPVLRWPVQSDGYVLAAMHRGLLALAWAGLERAFANPLTHPPPASASKQRQPGGLPR